MKHNFRWSRDLKWEGNTMKDNANKNKSFMRWFVIQKNVTYSIWPLKKHKTQIDLYQQILVKNNLKTTGSECFVFKLKYLL